ncbi:hypothetical protein YC2023_121214 [Brassica napus]
MIIKDAKQNGTKSLIEKENIEGLIYSDERKVQRQVPITKHEHPSFKNKLRLPQKPNAIEQQLHSSLLRNLEKPRRGIIEYNPDKITSPKPVDKNRYHNREALTADTKNHQSSIPHSYFHVRLAGGSFLKVSSHLQGRLMKSSHGGKGGDTRILILLA